MPQHFGMDPRMTSVGDRAESGSRIESLADMENRAIAQAMAALGGNLTRVASALWHQQAEAVQKTSALRHVNP